MTLVTNNAEGGSNGVTVTTSDTGSGTQWSAAVVSADAVLAYSNTVSYRGSLSYSIATRTSVVQSYLSIDNPAGGVAESYGRMYVYFDLAFGGGLPLLNIRQTTAGNGISCCYFSLSSTRVLRIVNGANSVTLWNAAAPLSLSTWYRIEWHYKCSADGLTGVAEARQYLGESTIELENSGIVITTPSATPATTFGTCRIGVPNAGANAPSATGFFYMDELAFYKETGWVGPYGGAGTTSDVAPIIHGHGAC